MSKPLKIAVLGFWHVHAKDYARQAQEHAGTELVAVWDDDLTLGEAGAEQFGVPFTGDLDGLLARDDLDGVVITTSTNVHRDLMVRAAKAGKHIFTEKVLAPTVPEAEEIVAAADDNGVKLVVSLPRLAHGYTQAIREVIDAGGLGQLTYGRVRLSHDGAIPRDGAEGWLPQRFFDRRDRHRWSADRPRLPSGLPDPAVPRHRSRDRQRDLSLGGRARPRGQRRRHRRLSRPEDRRDRGGLRQPATPSRSRSSAPTAALTYTDAGNDPAQGRRSVATTSVAGARPWQRSVRPVGRPHQQRHPGRRQPGPRGRADPAGRRRQPAAAEGRTIRYTPHHPATEERLPCLRSRSG